MQFYSLLTITWLFLKDLSRLRFLGFRFFYSFIYF